jgi:hypothetical protein
VPAAELVTQETLNSMRFDAAFIAKAVDSNATFIRLPHHLIPVARSKPVSATVELIPDQVAAVIGWVMDIAVGVDVGAAAPDAAWMASGSVDP